MLRLQITPDDDTRLECRERTNSITIILTELRRFQQWPQHGRREEAEEGGCVIESADNIGLRSPTRIDCVPPPPRRQEFSNHYVMLNFSVLNNFIYNLSMESSFRRQHVCWRGVSPHTTLPTALVLAALESRLVRNFEVLFVFFTLLYVL